MIGKKNDKLLKKIKIHFLKIYKRGQYNFSFEKFLIISNRFYKSEKHCPRIHTNETREGGHKIEN